MIHFIAIPKCASISVGKGFCAQNNIMVQWHDQSNRLWLRRHHKAMQEGNTVFCVLRDPADRVISAYNYLKNGGLNAWDRLCWDQHFAYYNWDPRSSPFKPEKEIPDLNKFVVCGLQRAAHEAMHLKPQWSWLDPEDTGLYEDRIEYLDFHNLDEDISEFTKRHQLKDVGLTHRNKTHRDENTLSEEALEIIKYVYQRDYELIERKIK